jgi:hypothetical protein
MDLNTLAQIGEFLGGLSVLLTLIYLAIQIRGVCQQRCRVH